MKKIIAITTLVIFLSAQISHASVIFTLTSPNIENGGTLSKKHEFAGFGCNLATLGNLDSCSSTNNNKIKNNGFDCRGGNVMPSFNWVNAPEKTKSFAFTVFDPDMPSGTGWWNFVVYNIAPNINKITNKIPEGAIASINDSGTAHYMGACPPKGAKHRYIFTVYALDVSALDILPTSTANMTAYMINQHKLASASLVATYER